jgi:hypothetical protein
MMKSRYNLLRVRILTVATAIFLAVSLMGCMDSIVADMEAEHRRLGNEAKQELQKSPAAYPPVSQTEALSTAL